MFLKIFIVDGVRRSAHYFGWRLIVYLRRILSYRNVTMFTYPMAAQISVAFPLSGHSGYTYRSWRPSIQVERWLQIVQTVCAMFMGGTNQTYLLFWASNEKRDLVAFLLLVCCIACCPYATLAFLQKSIVRLQATLGLVLFTAVLGICLKFISILSWLVSFIYFGNTLMTHLNRNVVHSRLMKLLTQKLS